MVRANVILEGDILMKTTLSGFSGLEGCVVVRGTNVVGRGHWINDGKVNVVRKRWRGRC